MRRTLADMKNPAVCRIAQSLNLDPDDERYVSILNEAQERLVTLGDWWGTLALYRCQATDGLFVWPPEVASVRGVAVCQAPLVNRDVFFEFSRLAMGIDGPTYGHIDQINMPTYAPVTGVTSQLKLYCDLADDVTLGVRFMGYDENGNWIRSEEPVGSGNWFDGELVLPSTIGALSTHIFSSVTGAQKQRSKGPFRLYAYDTATSTQTLLAVYEYDETNPWYRVTKVPGLSVSEGNSVTVDVLFKYDFQPVVEDTDYMTIGCIPALKDMCAAIKASESTTMMDQKARIIAEGIQAAKASLEMELRHYQGNPESVVAVEGAGGPMFESVPNLV